jgi:hypothetical protein
MIVRKPLALSLIALAIAAPGLASASSLYHPADGEVGVTTHPDHLQSTMSRDDVLQVCESRARTARWRPFRAAVPCLSKQLAPPRPVSRCNRNT